MKRKDKKGLEELTRKLAQEYFVHRNYVELVKYIDHRISWFGTGKNEVCCSLPAALRYIGQEEELYNGRMLISQEWYHATMVTEDMACVMASMDVEADPQSGYYFQIPLRFSVIYTRHGGGWKVCHLHNSVPYHGQGEASYFDREGAKENYSRMEALARSIAAEQIESTKIRDLLTGIQNTDGFVRTAQRLLREAAAGTEYAVVRFGVDSFRYVNQTYGYAMGDELLRSIAEALEESCEPDETCARVDKDNFALLLKVRANLSAEAWMRRVEPELVEPRLQGQMKGRLSFSGGIYPVTEADGGDVKKMLDKAMLAQKWNGEAGHSGYLYFDQKTYEWESYCATLLEQAPQAMSRGAFELYIQPQIDLKTERIVAGEALVRWRQPDGTLIMPGDFIPLFEKSDLIIEFDFHMLELLCRRLRTWLDAGIEPLPVSINQSRRHISRPDYVERFCRTVDRYAIPHHLIVFELTESAFVEGSAAVIALTERLHGLGFQLAIDDFGTGYAALNLLKMGADILKVDKSLLVDVELTRASRVILQKIIEMAKEMGMTVVCEGIEKRYQLDYLKSLHCDIGQGFYFSRPMPSESFERKMREERAAALV